MWCLRMVEFKILLSKPLAHVSFRCEVPTPSVFEDQQTMSFKPRILEHHIPELPNTVPSLSLYAKPQDFPYTYIYIYIYIHIYIYIYIHMYNYIIYIYRERERYGRWRNELTSRTTVLLGRRAIFRSLPATASMFVWDSSEGRSMQFSSVQGDPRANTTQETSGA